jgi:hypothetical protein
MMPKVSFFVGIVLVCAAMAHAFTPEVKRKASLTKISSRGQSVPDQDITSADKIVITRDNFPYSESTPKQGGYHAIIRDFTLPFTLVLSLLPLPAEAASPIGSGLVAYLHYAGLLICTGAGIVERLTIKPGMSEDEEKTLLAADIETRWLF